MEDSIYELETVKVRLRLREPRFSGMIKAPEDATRVLEPIFEGLDHDQEQLILLALDTRHRVRGYKTVASGGMCSAAVDPRVLFRTALLMGAAAVIVAHNHPSGDPTPSREDIVVYRRLAQAGTTLGLEVLDMFTYGDGRTESCARAAL